LRRRKIADFAALKRIERRFLAHRKSFVGILEFEQATRKVGTGVAIEFELHRLIEAIKPQLAAYAAFDAVINLATNHAVLNAPSHITS